MNIYVCNIPYSGTAPQLRSIFEEYGRVEKCEIIIDRKTQESRGFGFVEMPENGERAINAIHGQEWLGRILQVREAQSKEDHRANRKQNQPCGRH